MKRDIAKILTDLEFMKSNRFWRKLKNLNIFKIVVFFLLLKFYYSVALSLSQSLKIVACPALLFMTYIFL